MNLNSSTWRDWVFEGKNKEYGAYYLRRTSTKRHLYALAIVLGAVIAFVVSTFFLPYSQHFPPSDDLELEPVNLSDLLILDKFHYEEPVEPEKTKLQLKEEKKLSPPEVVQEEIVEEIPDEVTGTENLTDSISGDSITNSIVLSHPELITESEDSTVHSPDEMSQTQDYRILQAAILRYIYQHIRYPEVAFKLKKQGRVVCSFIINKDGSASDITLEEKTDVFLDEEVLRVMNSMPAWEPIKKDGKVVRVKYYLPVIFTYL